MYSRHFGDQQSKQKEKKRKKIKIELKQGKKKTMKYQPTYLLSTWHDPFPTRSREQHTLAEGLPDYWLRAVDGGRGTGPAMANESHTCGTLAEKRKEPPALRRRRETPGPTPSCCVVNPRRHGSLFAVGLQFIIAASSTSSSPLGNGSSLPSELIHPGFQFAIPAYKTLWPMVYSERDTLAFLSFELDLCERES